jgi:hypothetical protein
MDARSVVLQLPELLDVIFQHVETTEVVWRLPLVCRTWWLYIRDALRYRLPLQLNGSKGKNVMMVALAAVRVPWAQSVDLVAASDFGFECLLQFNQLKELRLDTSQMLPGTFRLLRRLQSLESLDLIAAAAQDLLCATQGPPVTFGSLRKLELRLCPGPESAKMKSAVLRFAGAVPALESLSLRNVPIDQSTIAAVLSVCPRLRVLHLWMWSLSTNPGCLSVMLEYGRNLQDVVLTVAPMFNLLFDPDKTETERVQYVSSAIDLLEGCKGLQRLELRNVQREMLQTAAMSVLFADTEDVVLEFPDYHTVRWLKSVY